jgi:hypothetical protein
MAPSGTALTAARALPKEDCIAFGHFSVGTRGLSRRGNWTHLADTTDSGTSESDWALSASPECRIRFVPHPLRRHRGSVAHRLDGQYVGFPLVEPVERFGRRVSWCQGCRGIEEGQRLHSQLLCGIEKERQGDDVFSPIISLAFDQMSEESVCYAAGGPLSQRLGRHSHCICEEDLRIPLTERKRSRPRTAFRIGHRSEPRHDGVERFVEWRRKGLRQIRVMSSGGISLSQVRVPQALHIFCRRRSLAHWPAAAHSWPGQSNSPCWAP